MTNLDHPDETATSEISVPSKPSAVGDRKSKTQLVDFAAAIKKEVKIAEERLHSWCKHLRRAGKLLCRVKAMLVHGQFEKWFEQSDFKFSKSTAERYMKLHREFDELREIIGADANPAALRDLTYSQALKLLTKPRQDDGDVERGCENKSTDDGQAALEPAANAADEERASVAPISDSPRRSSDDMEENPVESEGRVAGPEIKKVFDIAEDWLTPVQFIQPAEDMLGGIDLDPASDGERIPAKLHYTKADDGLHPNRAWQGRVFLNPPLTLAQQFVGRLLFEFESNNVTEAILIVPAMTDASWFRKLKRFIRAFLARPEFGWSDMIAEPLVAIYLGSRDSMFHQAFASLGHVYTAFGAGVKLNGQRPLIEYRDPTSTA